MNKEEYAKCVKRHICTSCYKPLPEGYTAKKCRDCYQKNKKYVKKSREKYKYKRYKYPGRCLDCNKELPQDYQYKTCYNCRVKRSQRYYEKKLSEEKKAAENPIKINNLEILSEFGYEALENSYVKELKGNYVLRVDKKTCELKCWNWVNGKIKDPTPHIQDLIKAGIVEEGK